MPRARSTVKAACIDAALPRLTPAQCAEVTRSFRRGIEDGLSSIDDTHLPAECHLRDSESEIGASIFHPLTHRCLTRAIAAPGDTRHVEPRA
jgi:hypothetical protein